MSRALVVSSCGGGALPSGAVNQLTMDTTGRLCSHKTGGGGGGSSVWSASDAAANGMTLSNGGLTLTVPSGAVAWRMVRNSISKTSGKLYLEVSTTSGSTDTVHIGLASAGVNIGNYLGASNYSFGESLMYGSLFASTGFAVGSSSNMFKNPILSTDVVALAVDFTANKAWVAINNVWNDGGNPATGLNPIAAFTPATVGPLFFAMAFNTASSGASAKASTVWTLRPTAASQTYAPPSGFSAWDGAGGCPQATAYLARAPGETTHAADLSAFICGLVTDGVWSNFDVLQVEAQQTQADALLNLVSTSYNSTIVGTGLVFTTFRGFSGFDTANAYLQTSFNPTTAPSPHFTQNNGSFGVWAVTVAAGNNAGEMGAGPENQINDDYNGVSFYGRINDTISGPVSAPNASGLYAADRSGSNIGTNPYYNGAQLTSFTVTSSAPTNASFTIGTVLPGPSTTQSLGIAFIASSLGSAGHAALYSRARTYATAVGVP